MVSNLENNCRCSLYTTVWKRKVVEPKSVSVEEHLLTEEKKDLLKNAGKQKIFDLRTQLHTQTVSIPLRNKLVCTDITQPYNSTKTNVFQHSPLKCHLVK